MNHLKISLNFQNEWTSKSRLDHASKVQKTNSLCIKWDSDLAQFDPFAAFLRWLQLCLLFIGSVQCSYSLMREKLLFLKYSEYSGSNTLLIYLLKRLLTITTFCILVKIKKLTFLCMSRKVSWEKCKQNQGLLKIKSWKSLSQAIQNEHISPFCIYQFL